jgi:DNA phosphorothioation-associated putative methyltransferase
VHRADGPKREADIVNLGYVLNVIENPAERVEALVDAHRHARRLLVVSALIHETVDMARSRHYGDGVLTRANTFQKFFEQCTLGSGLNIQHFNLSTNHRNSNVEY